MVTAAVMMLMYISGNNTSRNSEANKNHCLFLISSSELVPFSYKFFDKNYNKVEGRGSDNRTIARDYEAIINSN